MSTWENLQSTCSTAPLSTVPVKRSLCQRYRVRFLPVLILLIVVTLLLFYHTSNIRRIPTLRPPIHESHQRFNLHVHGMRRRFPGAIIIGVRKAGTRALLEYLNLHPRVYKCGKEPHFFDEEYEQGLEHYRHMMPYTFEGYLTIEKTPSYFTELAVPHRIYEFNPNIKLILIVRDPIIRVISDYTYTRMRKARKSQPYPTIEELVLDKDGNVTTEYKPIRTSIYHKYLERWLQWFDLSSIHIVDGDKLIKDPLPELTKVERFLQLPHKLTRDNIYFNETRGFYCLRNGSNTRCLAPSKGIPHSEVRPDVFVKLKQFYKQHNQKFFQIIDRTFDWL